MGGAPAMCLHTPQKVGSCTHACGDGMLIRKHQPILMDVRDTDMDPVNLIDGQYADGTNPFAAAWS